MTVIQRGTGCREGIGSAEYVRSVVEAVYEMIFKGLNQHFAAQRSAA